MVAPTKPQLVTANGKDSWFFVPAIADITAPTPTEINAATGLNISCFLWAEFEGVTSSTGKVTLPRLLCETQQYEANDSTTYSMSDLDFAFAPQAASATDGKKAWDKFKAAACLASWFAARASRPTMWPRRPLSASSSTSSLWRSAPPSPARPARAPMVSTARCLRSL